MMKRLRNRYSLLLLLIVLLGEVFRVFGFNWDGGFHLHPDERAIVIYTLPLQFPKNLDIFLSPQSPWNPHFFAYGSLPLYMLKVVSLIAGNFNQLLTGYDGINLLGRILSSCFDLGTIFLIFLIGKQIASKKVALLACFFYAIAVLPIQLSHFFAVDTILTFFLMCTLYCMIRFYQSESFGSAIGIGISLGFALATKTTAVAIGVSLALALTIDFLLLLFVHKKKLRLVLPHIPKFIKKLLLSSLYIVLPALLVFFFCEPYAFIDFNTFLLQNMQQYAMTKDAFTFPYTLQYVGKIPYIYELQNIFWWGLGPLFATIAFLGIIFTTVTGIIREKKTAWAKELILMAFFWSYFILVGKFAVGFVRYMLPLYPLLCLAASLFIFFLIKKFSNAFVKISIFIWLFLLLVWPCSFLAIYTHPNTRVQATNWILTHIPIGKTIAIEHWDDGLPLVNSQAYPTNILELYNMDTPEKWAKISKQLSQSSYIILASNRLYVPLQKLTDCAALFPHPCYVQTAAYYKQLFNGQLGFTKVAEFTDYPTIPFIGTPIIDDHADESFTVYDHPKVIIFQKNHIE